MAGFVYSKLQEVPFTVCKIMRRLFHFIWFESLLMKRDKKNGYSRIRDNNLEQRDLFYQDYVIIIFSMKYLKANYAFK